jgi:hypothetical protein
MTPLGQEIVLRAVGTALAGLSVAFAGYMLDRGEGRIRVNGMKHLAIFAQPRGTAPAARALALPSLTQPDAPVDLTTTGSVDGRAHPAAPPRPVEIVAVRADRVWLRIDGAIRAAVPGDDVPRVGRIASIVPRDGGWALLDDRGATLLTVAKRGNGASLSPESGIFE